jgi:hypothetical protein
MYKFYPYEKLRSILKNDKNIDKILKEKKEYLLNKDMKTKPPAFYIDSQLRREMCYYILENNYINIDSIPNIKSSIILPDKNIFNILLSLKSKVPIVSKIYDVFNLLKKYQNNDNNHNNNKTFNLNI